MLPVRLLLVMASDMGRDLMRHRGQHALAVLTLASGLVLAGGGLLAVETLHRGVAAVESMARVTVFAAEGATLQATRQQLERDPRFTAARWVSSEEATRRFRDMGREAGFMLGALGGEAIPEYLELTLRPDLMQGRKALEAGDSLRAMPGVGEVVVDQERLEAFQGMARMVRSALSVLAAVLLLAAGFATGNVIRMNLAQRDTEISIMRLVGASESFIRTPLLLEGAVLGFAGSLVSLGILYGLWMPLAKGFWSAPPLLVELARLGFFSGWNIAILMAVGGITGALGAQWGLISLRRQQRDPEP